MHKHWLSKMDAQFPSNSPGGGGDTMKINTKESIIVRPSQDIPQQRLWVSNLDLLQPRHHVPTVYLYRPNGSSDFFEAEVLKEALRKVLCHFIPWLEGWQGMKMVELKSTVMGRECCS
uniref:Uncharacterized protein n=1 Tax=Salix viminalis TaxID=40686 RepID=A0A6N2K9H1_SALVM